MTQDELAGCASSSVFALSNIEAEENKDPLICWIELTTDGKQMWVEVERK